MITKQETERERAEERKELKSSLSLLYFIHVQVKRPKRELWPVPQKLPRDLKRVN